MAKYVRYKNINNFASWCVTLKFFQSTFLTYIYNRVEMFINLFGTLRLPRKVVKLRLLRSPHVNKKSMESFELRSSKYLTFIFSSSVYKELRFLIDSMSVFYMHFLFEFNKNKVFVLKKWSSRSYLSVPLIGMFEIQLESVSMVDIIVSILTIVVVGIMFVVKNKKKIISCFTNFKWKLGSMFALVVFPVKFEEFNTSDNIKSKINKICESYVVEEDYENLPVDGSTWFVGGWGEEIDKDGNIVTTYDTLKALHDPANIDEVVYDPTVYGKSKNVEFFLRKEKFIQKVLNVLGEQDLKKLKQLYNAQWFAKDKDSNFDWSHFYDMTTGEVHHVEDLYNWKLIRHIHEIFWLERQVLDLNKEFSRQIKENIQPSIDQVYVTSSSGRGAFQKNSLYRSFQSGQDYISNSVWFNNDKKIELAQGIKRTISWLKNRHFHIPFDKYRSLKYNSYRDLKKSKSYPERSFSEIFQPYVLDADGVIESKRTVINIFGRDFTLPINFTEFDRQAITYVNQFMHNWFWKEKTYKWSWEDFKTWLEQENINTGSLTEEQLKTYAEGLETRYTLENMFTYEKSWYNRLVWYTHDHPYYTRVMKDRVYSWVESFDDETGEASMMAFRDGFWIDTVSCSEYLKIVRGEQDLVHERERIVYDAGLYYDQYSNSLDFARRVRWVKEYSETLNYYVDDLITDKLNFGDLALPKELLAKDSIGWFKIWPSYGSVMWDDRLDYKLESLYLSWISIFHTNIWHVTTYGGLFGGLSWLLFFLVLDIITSHPRMRATILGLRWRRLRTRVDRWCIDKMGIRLTYYEYEDYNAWMYITGCFYGIKYYHWLNNKSEYDYGHLKLKENMNNLHEFNDGKRGRIYSYSSRIEGYGFLDNRYEYDDLDRVYRPAILRNNNKNLGRAGYFSEKQTELSNLWNPVKYAFDILFTSFSEVINRFLFQHGLSRALLKAVVIEAAFVNKILNTLLDIPIKISIFISVYSYQLFIFVLSLPKEIFNMPGYIINIVVAIFKSIFNLYHGIICSIKFLFEEIISLWFFTFSVLNNTIKLWFYLIFIKPFESIWNFLDYCFNIKFWFAFFKNWSYNFKWDMYIQNREIMTNEKYYFNWFRRAGRRLFIETRMTNDLLQDLNSFGNNLIGFDKLRAAPMETLNIWYDGFIWKCWLLLDHSVVVFNQVKYLGFKDFFIFRLQRFCDKTLEHFFYKYYVTCVNDDPSRTLELSYFKAYVENIYWPYLKDVFYLNFLYCKDSLVNGILHTYNSLFYINQWSYYIFNLSYSFIYYPIYYIWRHTFGQAWVTLLYLTNLIWHWDYYSFSGGLSFSRLMASFGYSFSIFIAHIYNFFIQLKVMFVEGCKFYFEGIFYPFICLYWYFIKSKAFFISSFMSNYGLYVNIFNHSSICVYVRTLFSDLKTIYCMALGTTNDLPKGSIKVSLKESEELVQKLSVSDLYNNKQKYSKDVVDTYEKNPEAYVTDSWNLDPKITNASIDVYEELSKVNLFEDHYPLTASERVLDSLDMLDKAQRNIEVLRAIGRWHESVILQTVVYENHVDTRNYSWGFDKLPLHAKIWVPLHDYLVDFTSFSPIAPNFRNWIGETYVIWVLHPIKYFFYNPVMFQYIVGAFFKIPRYIYSTCSYIYNTLSSIFSFLIKLPGYLSDVFSYFFTYLRVTFGLTFGNFDIQFFIDMFYYWYYYVPHSYWKPRYLQHIMKDHWLYTANRFNYINKTFNFKPDGRWQNWRAKTSLWNRVYLKYWEGIGNNKSYFWLNRFVTFWQLIFSHRTPVQEREYEAKYVKSIKDEVEIKIYWLFDSYIPYWFKILRKRYIDYENVEHWFLTPNLRYKAKAELKRNDKYVGGLYPFKGQELIDFYKKITSYYISYSKEWLADFIYTGIVECFGWIHTFLTRVTPGGFYFHIMLMSINELKQIIFHNAAPNLKWNKRIVNADFHKEFTHVYLKFIFDFKEGAVNFLTTYQIVIVNYVKLVFNSWYVEPIKLKYNIDIVAIFKLPFSHYILFFTGVSYDLLWYYLKLSFSIIRFFLFKTYEGIEIICGYIVKYIQEITHDEILLLKVKIGFSIVKYFQGLEGRTSTLEKLFFGLNEPKENFKASLKLFFNGSLLEVNNLFLNGIKFIILLFKYLFESFGLIIMWSIEDFWLYFKLILNSCYNLFGKFVITLYEIYVLLRVNFLYIVESIFIYTVKLVYNLLSLSYGFCSAVYSWFFAMAAEYIIYFSLCIEYYFGTGYVFIEDWFNSCVLAINVIFLSPIVFVYNCIKSFISIFIYYNPKDGRISYFNLERLYLKFFVYFTDFYMFCSSDEFWWNNVFFMHIYRGFVDPVGNFIRDILPLESERYVVAPKMFYETFFEKAESFKKFTDAQGITGIRAKGIRGDYNRRLPWLIGKDQDHLDQDTVNLMWDTFDYQGLSNVFPRTIRNLWSMNKYISGYILMLEKTNLPDPVKRHFYLKRMRELYYHSMVTQGGRNHTYKEIRLYFRRVFCQDIFGKGKSLDSLAVYNKIHRYDKMIDAMDEVVRRYRVPDFMFRYWFTHRNSGRWKTPEIWNQLSDKDMFFLKEDSDIMFDDFNDFNMVKVFSARETYPRAFTHGYQNFHSRALDTYDFMAFNQKVYNFYLDMYGPTFAYILYHFPGHSLQLNASDLTVAERVQWLKDFVYRTESNLISATSLVHRLSNYEFQKRMEHYEDGVKLNFRWKDYFFLESQRQHKKAVRDLLVYGQPQKLWSFADAVDHRYSLQYPIVEYENIFHDDAFIETYYNSYFCGFGEENLFGHDESWYTDWDMPQRDLGVKHSWKIPVDSFYTSDFIDYKNSPITQFFFKEDYHYNCVWNPTDFRGTFKSDYKAWGVLPNGYALIGDLLKIHRPDLARELFGHNLETENGSIANYREYLYLQNRLMSRFDYNWMDTFRRTLLVTKDVYYSYMFGCGSFYTHREARPIVLDAPYIDITEYNNILHKRMNNKPLCYDYWVFYEDNVASSLNNFENLNVLNESMFYDAPSQWQMGFQDPASPIMEGIIDLHHDLCFFLILVSVFVSWVLFNIIYYFNSTNYNLKVRIQKWVHEEVRETLLDLVNMWYSFTIKLVDYSAKNKDNGLVNLLAQKCYNLTMLFIYWENSYFNKWYHDKELEHLVITSKLHANSLLPDNITDILKYIGKNDYNKVEYFFNEVEKKGYFVSKDNEELYNQFKNDPNTTCYSNRLGTILSNLVSIRDLQLQLSNSYFTDMGKEKSYIDSVIADDILAYEKFEEDFEEYQLKEEFVWFPQLFTHNTTIEVIWTIIPAVILIFIAVPSFSLLYAMDQIWQPLFTIKVLGNQWYWSYEYC